MNKIIPERLKKGDEVRIIAPSRSMNILSEETINIATKRLEDLGLKVTFGKNVNKVFNEKYGCASIEDRIEDLHDAFKDKNVKAILSVIGGFNVNQILDYIDYDLIKNNPKIICGFSDITALTNAIYAKTGLVTYSGPAYSSFGMKKGFEYSLEYFKKMFFEDEDIEITSSDSWSDEAWFIDQENRHFYKNEGMAIINNGSAEGTIIGGNLCTLNLLQGTEYMPELDNTILFIEDDDLVGDEYIREFDRDFVSLLQCYKNKKLNGIVIGRAQINSKMNIDKWKVLLESKNLKDIPIIINANFGHTTPIITFPVGGTAIIDNGKIVIKK
jgi:muramoyltetrapeptide carboxypeptidase LdcA involved in peptidoglycan recycling